MPCAPNNVIPIIPCCNQGCPYVLIQIAFRTPTLYHHYSPGPTLNNPRDFYLSATYDCNRTGRPGGPIPLTATINRYTYEITFSAPFDPVNNTHYFDCIATNNNAGGISFPEAWRYQNSPSFAYLSNPISHADILSDFELLRNQPYPEVGQNWGGHIVALMPNALNSPGGLAYFNGFDAGGNVTRGFGYPILAEWDNNVVNPGIQLPTCAIVERRHLGLYYTLAATGYGYFQSRPPGSVSGHETGGADIVSSKMRINWKGRYCTALTSRVINSNYGSISCGPESGNLLDWALLDIPSPAAPAQADGLSKKLFDNSCFCEDQNPAP